MSDPAALAHPREQRTRTDGEHSVVRTKEQLKAAQELRTMAPGRRLEFDVEGWPVVRGQRGRIEYHDGHDLSVAEALQEALRHPWSAPAPDRRYRDAGTVPVQRPVPGREGDPRQAWVPSLSRPAPEPGRQHGEAIHETAAEEARGGGGWFRGRVLGQARRGGADHSFRLHVPVQAYMACS